MCQGVPSFSTSTGSNIYIYIHQKYIYIYIYSYIMYVYYIYIYMYDVGRNINLMHSRTSVQQAILSYTRNQTRSPHAESHEYSFLLQECIHTHVEPDLRTLNHVDNYYICMFTYIHTLYPFYIQRI